MKIRIPIEEFKRLLIRGQCNEFKQAYQRLFYNTLMLHGEPPNWEVDDDILQKAIEQLKEKEAEEHRLSETARLNNIGIAAEKAGDIKKAIEAYEKNIKIGYLADHAYKRLRIIYRRNKDYLNMRRVIERYAEVYGLDKEWIEKQYKRFAK